MGKIYKHWSQFPMGEWRWPNFRPEELASKSDGELMIDEDALDRLQKLRNILGVPLLVTSAYRSEAHNRKVGGAKGSQHRKAKAYDVIMTNLDPAHFVAIAKSVGFKGIGYYPKQNFIHIDTGPARSWGTPFPSKVAETPNFTTEPQRDSIASLLTKPEILAGVGGVISAGGAITQGNGPFQYAVAAIAVVAAIGIAAVVVWQLMKRPADV